MPRLLPTAPEAAGALAGAVAIGLAYAAGRRLGWTRSDVAQRVAPGRPLLGRAAQLALGCGAALPGTRVSTPLRAAVLGASIGTLAAGDSRAFSAGAHALAAVVGQRVARR